MLENLYLSFQNNNFANQILKQTYSEQHRNYKTFTT